MIAKGLDFVYPVSAKKWIRCNDAEKNYTHLPKYFKYLILKIAPTGQSNGWVNAWRSKINDLTAYPLHP